jgi:transposase-like protein
MMYVSCPNIGLHFKVYNNGRKHDKSRKRHVRYSLCFKEKVVQEISEGSSISEVCRRYGIKGGDTVQGWIKKFGRSELLNEIVHIKTKGEMEETKRLESENKRLKILLGELYLSKQDLEILIDRVNAHYHIDVVKDFGGPPKSNIE